MDDGYTSAGIVVDVPALGGPVGMNVTVPGRKNAPRRIATHAYVIIQAYLRAKPDVVECLWCGEEPEGGTLYWQGGPISEAPPGPYCSTSCWLSAS